MLQQVQTRKRADNSRLTWIQASVARRLEGIKESSRSMLYLHSLLGFSSSCLDMKYVSTADLWDRIWKQFLLDVIYGMRRIWKQYWLWMRVFQLMLLAMSDVRQQTRLDLGRNCFSQQFILIDFMARFGFIEECKLILMAVIRILIDKEVASGDNVLKIKDTDVSYNVLKLGKPYVLIRLMWITKEQQETQTSATSVKTRRVYSRLMLPIDISTA
ncbi:hypothetical protein Tco_0006785 [Tanacetum coccineum]